MLINRSNISNNDNLTALVDTKVVISLDTVKGLVISVLSLKWFKASLQFLSTALLSLIK